MRHCQKIIIIETQESEDSFPHLKYLAKVAKTIYDKQTCSV